MVMTFCHGYPSSLLFWNCGETMKILKEKSGFLSESLNLRRVILAAGCLAFACSIPTSASLAGDTLETTLASLKGEVVAFDSHHVILAASSDQVKKYKKHAEYFKKKAKQAKSAGNMSAYKKFITKHKSAFAKYQKYLGASNSGGSAALASSHSATVDADKYKKSADYFQKKADENRAKAAKYKKGSTNYKKYMKTYDYYVDKSKTAYAKYVKYSNEQNVATTNTAAATNDQAAKYLKYASYFEKQALKNKALMEKYKSDSNLFAKYAKLYEYYTDKYASAYGKYLKYGGKSAESGSVASYTKPESESATVTTQPGAEQTGVTTSTTVGGDGKAISVRSQSDFDKAISNLAPGDHIVVAAGTYRFPDVNKGGSSSQPIIIEAERAAVSGGNTIIDGHAVVRGDHITIKGFFFKANKTTFDAISLLKVNNVNVIENRFEHIDTDYGVRVHSSQDITIEGNVFKGQYNHAVSSKELVSNMVVRNNQFVDCGRGCIEAGQSPDGQNKDEQTSWRILVTNNSFVGSNTGGKKGFQGIGVKVKNANYTLIQKNSFSGKWNFPVQTSFGSVGGKNDSKAFGHFGSRHPEKIEIVDNDFGQSGTLDLSGRGRQYDYMYVKNNKGSIGCRIGDFRAHGSIILDRIDWSTIYKGKPKVMDSKNTFSCN
ncbi:MAG: chondroitinase-B domain-containing protein [Geminicoccaceae bacterium]